MSRSKKIEAKLSELAQKINAKIKDKRVPEIEITHNPGHPVQILQKDGSLVDDWSYSFSLDQGCTSLIGRNHNEENTVASLQRLIDRHDELYDKNGRLIFEAFQEIAQL